MLCHEYSVFQPCVSKEKVMLSSQPFCDNSIYNNPYSLLQFSSRFTFLLYQRDQKIDRLVNFTSLSSIYSENIY